MLKCAYCGTAIEQGAERCPQCEARIVWEGDTPEFLVPGSHVAVHAATDPAKLEVIKSLLAANEIPFLVLNEISQDFLGWGRLPIGYNIAVGPPLVVVRAESEEAARELIDSARHVPAYRAQAEQAEEF